ncbi:MAG: hypothetical protein QOK29_2519 [Rhodospirillaceae bacterium]|jgi:hypothetical protein|nr:hypothetical protein [Rhodospirillaceae bacterium]
MLQQIVQDRRAWTGNSLGGQDALVVPLESKHLAAFDECLRRLPDRELPLRSIGRAAYRHPVLDALFSEVLEELRDGRGIVLLRRLPVERFSRAEIDLIYWGIGTHLGAGVSQSVLGDMIGEVRDMTPDDPHARAYRNKQELTLHTDLCDIIGMLSMQPAMTGGVSSYASVYAVHNRILETRPDLLAPLYAGFNYHRRGEEGPGEAPITPHKVPLFAYQDGQLSARYVRSYLTSAMDAMKVSDPRLIEALDLFDSTADELAVKFVLQPGEITLINNMTVMHSRTAFEDWPEKSRKRLLLRLWLTHSGFRSTPPEFRIYGSSEGIEKVEGKQPSFAGIE